MSEAQQRLEEALLFLEQRTDALDELVRDLYDRLERAQRRIEALENVARDDEAAGADDGTADSDEMPPFDGA